MDEDIDIKRLRLCSGDILVCRLEHPTAEMAEKIGNHFRKTLDEAGHGDVQLLIAPLSMQLEIVSKPSADLASTD